jgi:hypothetical protein
VVRTWPEVVKDFLIEYNYVKGLWGGVSLPQNEREFLPIDTG